MAEEEEEEEEEEQAREEQGERERDVMRAMVTGSFKCKQTTTMGCAKRRR
jgi:hypothetical protein